MQCTDQPLQNLDSGTFVDNFFTFTLEGRKMFEGIIRSKLLYKVVKAKIENCQCCAIDQIEFYFR